VASNYTVRAIRNVLPYRVQWILFFLYGCLKRPLKSYSQKGEDAVLDCYFGRRGDLYYLDIGCFHPVWASNTYLFHRRGWRGAVVDIDKDKLRSFRFLRRSRVVAIFAAVVGNPVAAETVPVYKFKNYSGWSLIDTLDKNTADINRSKGWGDYRVESAPVVDINSLLQSLPPVNFLNIDVEGIDKEIVASIDLTRFKIDAILFEDLRCDTVSEKVENHLIKHGYRPLFRSGGGLCYVLSRP